MSDLEDLRLRAIDLARAASDESLLDLRAQLEADAEWWASIWAPSLAIAASRLGKNGEAWHLLENAVRGGFCQPEIFEGELERQFANHPSWPKTSARIRANVPAPDLELLEWPDPEPAFPLVLFRCTAEREASLRGRAPAAQESALGTALDLLRWAHTRWEHTGGNHAKGQDAVAILDRVDVGERFACVEYSVVLTQTLNAFGIPARRVGLRQHNYHQGFGRGHVVSEAWIDELRRWVLLDGQNGAYWCDEDGEPIGVAELHSRYLRGEPRPELEGLAVEYDAAATDLWWSYFAYFDTTGFSVANTGYPLPFETSHLVTTERLTNRSLMVHPDLSQVAVGITGTIESPAVKLEAFHPYKRQDG